MSCPVSGESPLKRQKIEESGNGSMNPVDNQVSHLAYGVLQATPPPQMSQALSDASVQESNARFINRLKRASELNNSWEFFAACNPRPRLPALTSAEFVDRVVLACENISRGCDERALSEIRAVSRGLMKAQRLVENNEDELSLEDDRELNYRLAQCYIAKGNVSFAIDLLVEIIEDGPTGEMKYYAHSLYANLVIRNKHEELESLLETLETLQDDPDIHFKLLLEAAEELQANEMGSLAETFLIRASKIQTSD